MKLSVSAVIVAHNAEAFLGEAIESVLAQTYRCSEIFVIDDASEDATPSVTTSFADRVRYERIDRRSAGAARNRGLELARGDLVGFLDYDDLWTDTKTSLQVEVLSSDSAVEAVFGQVEEFLDVKDGKTYRALHQRPMHASPSAALFRRDVFERVGPFVEDLTVGEWAEWYTRAHDADLKEIVLDEVVLHRRIHGGNLTARNPGSMDDYIRVAHASLQRRRAAKNDPD